MQLRMAVAGAQLKLRDLADETGLDASQISRIQRGDKGASADTMRKLELAFTRRGFEFRQHNGHVCICVPDQPNEEQ